jgi:hypothetical protein
VLGVLLLALVAPAGADAAAGPSSPDAGPPLVLTNEHIGMTAAQIEALQPAVEPPPARTEPAPTSESQARAEALEAEAEAARARARQAALRAETAARAVEAAEAGLIPGLGPNRQGAARYETCIEALIRHGDSYAESDRVCRAVFGGAGAAH